ncbi:MAG: AlpA family transcriptional regulator [Methylibium sp.]|nr:AlpA family transcriptional regulator [Methylibium sp.]
MQSLPYKIAGSDQDPPKFFRLPMVLQITGLGRSTIYRLIAKHQFPEPVRIADRAVAWRQVDLETWIEGRPPAH